MVKLLSFYLQLSHYRLPFNMPPKYQDGSQRGSFTTIFMEKD